STTHSGRLDDLCPTGDVFLHEVGEWLLTAARLVWDFADEVEQPLARNIVIECPIQGVGEFVENRFRCPLGSKQRKPGRYFELRQPPFLHSRQVGKNRSALPRINVIVFFRPTLQVWYRVETPSIPHILILPADERVNGGSGAIEGHEGRLCADN